VGRVVQKGLGKAGICRFFGKSAGWGSRGAIGGGGYKAVRYRRGSKTSLELRSTNTKPSRNIHLRQNRKTCGKVKGWGTGTGGESAARGVRVFGSEREEGLGRKRPGVVLERRQDGNTKGVLFIAAFKNQGNGRAFSAKKGQTEKNRRQTRGRIVKKKIRGTRHSTLSFKTGGKEMTNCSR